MPAQASAPALLSVLPFMASPTPMPPAGMIPGLSPMVAPSAPPTQSNPWAHAQPQPQVQPQPQAGAQPMFNPWMMMVPMAPPPQAAPAQPAVPETAALPPLDPAVFMQMFMKPTEAPVAK